MHQPVRQGLLLLLIWLPIGGSMGWVWQRAYDRASGPGQQLAAIVLGSAACLLVVLGGLRLIPRLKFMRTARAAAGLSGQLLALPFRALGVVVHATTPDKQHWRAFRSAQATVPCGAEASGGGATLVPDPDTGLARTYVSRVGVALNTHADRRGGTAQVEAHAEHRPLRWRVVPMEVW